MNITSTARMRVLAPVREVTITLRDGHVSAGSLVLRLPYFTKAGLAALQAQSRLIRSDLGLLLQEYKEAIIAANAADECAKLQGKKYGVFTIVDASPYADHVTREEKIAAALAVKGAVEQVLKVGAVLPSRRPVVAEALRFSLVFAWSEIHNVRVDELDAGEVCSGFYVSLKLSSPPASPAPKRDLECYLTAWITWYVAVTVRVQQDMQDRLDGNRAHERQTAPKDMCAGFDPALYMPFNPDAHHFSGSRLIVFANPQRASVVLPSASTLREALRYFVGSIPSLQ